jgi:hypothetical protein
MGQLMLKNHFRHCLIALPFVVLVLLLAFWGIWGAHRAYEDAHAYRMADRVDAEANGLASKLYRLLTVNHDSAHWTPISYLILYPTLVDDTNRGIVLINLVVLGVASVLAGCFSRALGAGFWPAIFCSVWIASSQALVLPLATCWGTLNMLPSVFTMSGAWVLWRWLNESGSDDGTSKIRWRFLFGFIGFLTLAVLTKETGIRGLVLAAGVFVIVLVYRRGLQYRKEMGVLMGLILAWVVLYTLIRYTFTDAQVPLLRDAHLGGYKQMRLDGWINVRNIGTLLLGSINPVNSYAIYLKTVWKEYLEAALFLLPAISWGVVLISGWLSLIVKASRQNKISALFVAILSLCSLFPEFLLGEVSEYYAMATLWPLALLSAIVLTYIWAKKGRLRYVLMPIVCLLSVSNICSSRAKVREILATGRNAHEIRQSMRELTRDLPSGSKIAVFYKPHSKEAFARFGPRGIETTGIWYGGDRNVWALFEFGDSIPRPEEFDLILKESKDQRKLEVVAPDELRLWRSQPQKH